MQILIDGDSCPVKESTFKIAKKHGIPVTILYSLCHQQHIEGVEVVMVDNHPQEVDHALLNRCNKGDIVITGDWGLAAICIGKGARVISFKGKIYSPDKMDELLFIRHVSMKIRKSGGKVKGPSAMKSEDITRFELNLQSLILEGKEK